MNTNSKSFNFSVSNKSSSQTNEEKIKNKLKPQNIIDVKAKLKNGGEILLEEQRENVILIYQRNFWYPNIYLR